jgi:hypothetical protein
LAPWIVVFAVSLISVATAAFYLRDPEKPER